MLRRALVNFAELRNEMNALAPLVAGAEKLPAGGDYRSVLRALKKKQLTNASLMPLYSKRLATLEEIARRERVVTLPARKAVIRLASEAESAMQPAILSGLRLSLHSPQPTSPSSVETLT